MSKSRQSYDGGIALWCCHISIAWKIMNDWLSDYQYHTDLCIQSRLTNPTKSLREEYCDISRFAKRFASSGSITFSTEKFARYSYICNVYFFKAPLLT